MRLVDTHTHTWGPETGEFPWQATVLPPGWEGSYTNDNLIADMDRAGVDESVIVTPPKYGRGRRANEYTLEGIREYPDRLYGVGLMDFFQDETGMRESLRRATSHDRMLGVRMHAALEYEAVPHKLDRTGDWILDERLSPFWEEAQILDANVFIFPKAQQLSQISTLAARYPDVTIVIDHMAWPDETTEPNQPPWDQFESIAVNDNVYVKVSSLPRSSNQAWPYADLHEYVRNLVNWFGPERLLLGSDYPWMDDWAAYEDCLAWLAECDGLSARDRRYLSWRTFDSFVDR